MTANTLNTIETSSDTAINIASDANNIFGVSSTLFLLIKIIGAILGVVVLIRISKLASRIIKGNIIKHLPNQGHGEEIANLLADITFYILAIFSIFIVFSGFGFDVGIIL
jgi:hypothetical protein